MTSTTPPQFDPTAIERPARALLHYYLLCAALTTVGFPFVVIPLFLRFISLRYRFDAEGISMSWGVLFHKEVYLTYRRIQDIHVTRNLLHRWFGLANVAVQTASGTAGAEMTLEGIEDPEGLRDYLYSRMRGARAEPEESAPSPSLPPPTSPLSPLSRPSSPPEADRALVLLEEIRDELRRVSKVLP